MPLAAKENSVPSPRTYVVLCIDDHVEGLVTRRAFLETFGYTVQTLTNGAAALALVSQMPPDIVLLDYRLPVMDGLEVAEHLRAGWPELPIIVLTGVSGQVPQRLRELATSTVTKGAPPVVLLEAMQKALCGAPEKPAPLRKGMSTAKAVVEVREYLARSKTHTKFASEKSFELKKKLAQDRRRRQQ